PIDEELRQCIRQLFGEGTGDRDLEVSADGRRGRWPLRVPDAGDAITSLSFHVYLCATFLTRRRSVVDRIHALGCNLELSLRVPSLTEYFSLAVATMKQLADLDVQFSLVPTDQNAHSQRT